MSLWNCSSRMSEDLMDHIPNPTRDFAKLHGLRCEDLRKPIHSPEALGRSVVSRNRKDKICVAAALIGSAVVGAIASLA